MKKNKFRIGVIKKYCKYKQKEYKKMLKANPDMLLSNRVNTKAKIEAYGDIIHFINKKGDIYGKELYKNTKVVIRKQNR